MMNGLSCARDTMTWAQIHGSVPAPLLIAAMRYSSMPHHFDPGLGGLHGSHPTIWAAFAYFIESFPLNGICVRPRLFHYSNRPQQ